MANFKDDTLDTATPILKKYVGVAALIFGLFFSSCVSFADGWKYEWQQDKMTGEQQCLVFSSKLFLSTGYGTSGIYLGVQSNGQFSLHSTDAPFDVRFLSQIGVKIDENPPIFAPQATANSKLMLFSKKDSLLIQQQLAKGKAVRIQVVFFPKDERVSGIISANGAMQSIAQYNGCRMLVNSQGWLGLFAVDLGREATWMEWLKKHTKSTEPGAIVITVDPRKVAAKAGIETGDAIIALNGDVVSVGSLIKTTQSMKANEEVTLTIVRGERVIKKKIKRP